MQMIRHGDRTPKITWPTDLHEKSEWPTGFGGQLTLVCLNKFSLHEKCTFDEMLVIPFFFLFKNKTRTFVNLTIIV